MKSFLFLAGVASAQNQLDGAPAAQTPWWDVSSFENAMSLALFFDRESRRHFVYREGHIHMSAKASKQYFEIARMPGVRRICEIGFNAGHSTAIWLNANPQAEVLSFDLGQFDYTIDMAQLATDLFPRLEMVWGPSQDSVPKYFADNPDTRCDVISVDGDHSTEGTYADLVNMHKMASCRNWVLMDDAGWKSTNMAWQQAKDEGLITQIECYVDMTPRPHWLFLTTPDNRSWCLGYFNVDDPDCPAWFPPEHAPEQPVTKVNLLPDRTGNWHYSEISR